MIDLDQDRDRSRKLQLTRIDGSGFGDVVSDCSGRVGQSGCQNLSPRHSMGQMKFAMSMKSAWLAFFALAALPSVHAQNLGYAVEVLPAAPVVMDSVIVRISSATNCGVDPNTVRVTQSPDAVGAIRINILPLLNCLPFPLPTKYDVSIGELPTGDYSVELVYSTTKVAAANFTIASNPAHDGERVFPLVNYTDHWWAQEESGWGLFVVQHPSDRVFAGWFVYDPEGRPVWYTLQPGSWTRFDTFTGPVYKSSGPYFGGPFDPAKVTRTIVGSATLTFQDSGTATFSYSVEGVSGVKKITRLPF